MATLTAAIPTRIHWPYVHIALFLVGAAVWSALPVLVHGYNFPPNNDPHNYLRSIEVQNTLPYLGHMIARGAASLTVYYYMTPFITAVFLLRSLRHYGIYAPMFVWVVLWLVVRPPLFEMFAGTFIAVIGFYAVTIAAMSVFSDWIRGTRRWTEAAGASFAAGVFHNSSSIVLLISAALYSLIWKRVGLLVLLPLLGWKIFAGIAWGGNAVFVFKPLIVALNMFGGTDTFIQSHLGNTAVPHSAVPDFTIWRFFGEYMGWPVAITVWIAGAVLTIAWFRGWRPARDPLIIMLLITVSVLPFTIFGPIEFNDDRLSKLMMGSLAIVASVGIIRGLQYLNDKRATAIILGSYIAVIVVALLDNLPYWLRMGAFI